MFLILLFAEASLISRDNLRLSHFIRACAFTLRLHAEPSRCALTMCLHDVPSRCAFALLPETSLSAGDFMRK